MKLYEMEQSMIAEARANRGCVKLDFANPAHYQFFVENLGGEERVREQAPDLYHQLQEQRTAGSPMPRPREEFLEPPGIASSEDTLPVLHLRDYHRIEGPAITASGNAASDGKSSLMANVSCMLRSSNTPQNTCAVTSRVKIYDVQMGGKPVADNSYELTPNEFGEYSVKPNMHMTLSQIALGHTYQFTSLFTSVANCSALGRNTEAYYVVASHVVANVDEKVKNITLSHPCNRNSSKRDSLKDSICISYSRDGNLQTPDYSYGVYDPGRKSAIPVHLPIHLCVELKGGASFESIDNSYFDSEEQPQISVMNLTSPDGAAEATGESAFMMDAEDFTKKYVTTEVNPQTGLRDKLHIHFSTAKEPGASSGKDDLWPKDLDYPIPKGYWDACAYAVFYAYIRFNVVYDGIHCALPIIINYEKDHAVSYQSGENNKNLYIHRLYYQWGCLAGDVQLWQKTGTIAARDVHQGDLLLTREGDYRPVRDVITGPSETIYRLILACGSEVLLTGDHTLCRADGNPVAASSVHVGDSLQIFQTDDKRIGASQVVSLEVLPYDDTVYNFVFEEPTFIVAQGIVVGDHDYQQAVRPFTPPRYELPKPDEGARLLIRQLRTLAHRQSTPDFVESDARQKAMFYYCAVKTILALSRLFTEDEAQEIAEFCAFLESNATYGGIPAGKEVPEELINRKLAVWGDDCVYVKMIPTAMAKWYDHDEILKTQTWKAPTAPAGEEPAEFTFRVQEDILVPFHYPVKEEPVKDGDPALVKYKPEFIQKMLDDIIQKSKEAENGALSRTALNMGMGTVLHLLIDTKFHAGYTGFSSWQNLKKTKHIYDHNRRSIADKYPPYRDYADAPYDPAKNYPAGLEQTGGCVDMPFTQFDYIYPSGTYELIGPYTNYKTFVNSVYICRALHDATGYLYRYKNKNLDERTWTDQYEQPLTKALEASYGTAEECLSCWKGSFSYIQYSYEPDKVYKRLTEGREVPADGGEDKRNYEELFQYTLMLDQIQKGGNLYD